MSVSGRSSRSLRRSNSVQVSHADKDPWNRDRSLSRQSFSSDSQVRMNYFVRFYKSY